MIINNGDYTRGLDTLFQSVRMFISATLKIALVSIAVAIAMTIAIATIKIPAYEGYVARWWAWAWFISHEMNQDKATITLQDEEQNQYTYLALDFATNNKIISIREDAVVHIRESAMYGAFAGCGAAILLAFYSIRRGRRLREERLIRGGRAASDKQVARMLRRQKKASSIALGQIPIVINTETQTTLIEGSSGSGKSQLTASIMAAIRERLESAVIYDPTGEYLSCFYREGDVILCPLDARSPYWDPWKEIRHPADAIRIATSLVPSNSNSQDAFWTLAAQRLLAGALLSLLNDPERSIAKLIELLTNPSLESISSAMRGLPIAAAFSVKPDSKNEFAQSIRGTLLPFIESLNFLRSSPRQTQHFSIRDWVEYLDKKTSRRPWVFVLSRADYQQAIKPIISMWLDCFAASLMSLPPNPDRRLWFVLDEMPSLNRLPSVPKLMAEARKFGAACVVSIQTFAQLRATYGVDEAEAITGLCNTFAVFRTTSPDTAQWVSRLLGEREIEEARESMTYSATDSRDGIHLSTSRRMQPIVMPTEIMQLEPLHFFVKLAGSYPIAPTSIPYTKRVPVIVPYMDIDVDDTSWSTCLASIPKPDAGGSTAAPIAF